MLVTADILYYFGELQYQEFKKLRILIDPCYSEIDKILPKFLFR